MNRLLAALFTWIFISGTAVSQNSGIQWLTFEEAEQQMQVQPKKVFIDVFTTWCGWCKKLDATTFKDPQIIDFINKNYYAVKFNAETRDTITLNNTQYVFKPENRANDLAVALLNGRLTYPTTVYLDENFNMLSPVPGYLTADVMMKILKYFGENHHKTISWEDYQKM
jgi:thioredoxin-related protein